MPGRYTEVEGPLARHDRAVRRRPSKQHRLQWPPTVRHSQRFGQVVGQLQSRLDHVAGAEDVGGESGAAAEKVGDGRRGPRAAREAVRMVHVPQTRARLPWRPALVEERCGVPDDVVASGGRVERDVLEHDPVLRATRPVQYARRATRATRATRAAWRRRASEVLCEEQRAGREPEEVEDVVAGVRGASEVEARSGATDEDVEAVRRHVHQVRQRLLDAQRPDHRTRSSSPRRS